MKGNVNLSAELTVELEKTISNLDAIDNEAFLKNYSSVTVSPLLKRCQTVFE